jgi:hypothetical protein
MVWNLVIGDYLIIGAWKLVIMKLPANKGRASRKGNLIYIVPLDPAYKAGLARHLPVK